MHYTIMLVTICNISLISLFFLDGEILDVWNRYFFGVSPIIKPVMQPFLAKTRSPFCGAKGHGW